MSSTHLQAIQLAAILLAGPWNAASMHERAVARVDCKAKVLRKYIRRTLKQFPTYRPRHRQLAEFLYQSCLSAGLQEDTDAVEEFGIADSAFPTVFNCQHESVSDLDIPRWETVRDLTEWLDIDDARMLWLADQKGLERTVATGPLRHYHYRWIRKRRSGFRLIESPKRHLKQIQRRLLFSCLQRLPIHDNAHGFRRGRSVTSYTSMHTESEMVLRMDLQNFFPSLVPWRLTQLLMLVGYCEDVARMITGLCTNVVPSDVWTTRNNTEYDVLKATLHNAVLHGPESQNRTGHTDFRSHLLGRINYLAQFNPGRADKLREEFHRIQWT